MMLLYKTLKKHAVAIACALFLPGCIFDSNTGDSVLTCSYLGIQRDTVSPEPTLRFAFSSPLSSTLDFDFSPAIGQQYAITFDSAHDTASLSLLEPLPSDTRYVLTFHSSLIGKDGSRLDPGKDSVVFITGHAETEPNNSPSLADTLTSSIYGFLSTSRDTDYYCVVGSHARYYCIASENTLFSVSDSAHNPVQIITSGSDASAFSVPDSTRYPIFVCFYSLTKGVVENYKFGILKQ